MTRYEKNKLLSLLWLLFVSIVFTAFFPIPFNLAFAETQETCGPVTPTYYYFSKIVPQLDYPDKYLGSYDEYFTQEHADEFQQSLSHPIQLPQYPHSPSLNSYHLDQRYTDEEMECWAKAGDQLASSIHGKAYYALSNYLKTISRNMFVDIAESQFSKSLVLRANALQEMQAYSHEIEALLARLERDAQIPVALCDIDDGLDDAKLFCKPDTMLGVFELGVPLIYYKMYNIYYAGPTHLRDRDKAFENLVYAALLGHQHSNTILDKKLFECEAYATIKKRPAFLKRFKYLYRLKYLKLWADANC